MAIHKVERKIGGKTLSIETGKMAKQAAGAVVVQLGDTVVMTTVVTGKPREGVDFFPLTVDYREKAYAAGKFPGGFFKREGRPSQKEILTMRMTDRPIRPMFPPGFMDEVVIQSMVLSTDQENEPDILCMIGASACLAIAPIPFLGPIGAVRLGRVKGEFVAFPTTSELEESELDMLVAGHREAINMIEVAANEAPDDVIVDGFSKAHEVIRVICDMISELASLCAVPSTWTPPEPRTGLVERVRELAMGRMREFKRIPDKQERKTAVEALYEEVTTILCPPDVEEPEFLPAEVFNAVHELEGEVVTRMILEEGVRSDGRKPDDIREIIVEVGVLPRTHGSALFTRGQTQALVTATLGTARDQQIVDGLTEEYKKNFMLHYNFPPFCTGEVKRIGAVSRREIGHGALAERSLEPIVPSSDKFPYTVRLVSDIMESNGSSSMASVCGGTLAMMDAGIPIKQPVAGISIGSVHDDRKRVLLVDILGEEDHFGDMDFKVAGTQRGVTGVQLDLKESGISMETIRDVMAKAKTARLHILRQMLTAIDRPRATISEYAPRILTIKINPEKIGKVIGPGGKGIRAIEADTGATIEIEDDGTIFISCVGMEGAEKAKGWIEAITDEVKVGNFYEGRVTSIKDFGAFIEIAPGQDGLCHISELSDGYVKNVSDVCKIGDTLRVKVILIDDQGRVKLSRKQALLEEAAMSKG